jgi:hypothetical protein
MDHLEYAEAANSVVLFYTTSLSSCMGAMYKPPSLSYLASLWFQGSSGHLQSYSLHDDLIILLDELRQAIRIVFDASVSTMSDEEAILTLEHWQHYRKLCHNLSHFVGLNTYCFLVPCLQLPSERESLTAALSLFICGFIGAEKYSFMSAQYVELTTF